MSFARWDWDWLTIGWVLWIAGFFVLEGVALYLEAKGHVEDETLTDHVWWLRDNGPSVVWFFLLFLVTWLGYHFLFERKSVGS
jgi:ribose/xylose/arabinose/galactoside ABC-type transport system permease subunit